MGEFEWVVCPMCKLSRKFHKTGKYHYQKKGELDVSKPPSDSSFDKFNLSNDRFIEIRSCLGGYKGGGFPIVKEFTIPEILHNSEYQDLLQQIDNFCKNWLKFRKLKR